MKKLGFTLAEILITLGIIGVVAALTAPSLVVNSRNEANAAKLAVVVSNLENAFTSAIAQEGVDSLYQTRMWSGITRYNRAAGEGGLNANSSDADIARFMGELGRYMVLNGYRREETDDFYHRAGATTYRMTANGGRGVAINFGNEGDGPSFPIILKNGAVIFFRAFGRDSFDEDENAIRAAGGSYIHNAADVFVDVNGTSEPNIVGRDIFAFGVGNNGILYPAGGRDEIIHARNGAAGIDYGTLTWDNEDNNANIRGRCCLDGQISVGWGCTARLIEQNYKMTY